jgi:hypothetical protein
MPVLEHVLREVEARQDGGNDPADQRGLTKEAFVSSITLAMIAITVVSFCLARRLVGVSCYTGLPLARWCKPSIGPVRLSDLIADARSDLCHLHRQLAICLFQHRAAVEFRPE